MKWERSANGSAIKQTAECKLILWGGGIIYSPQPLRRAYLSKSKYQTFAQLPKLYGGEPQTLEIHYIH